MMDHPTVSTGRFRRTRRFPEVSLSFILGIVDVANSAAYVFGTDPVTFHAAALLAKFLMLFASYSHYQGSVFQRSYIICFLLALVPLMSMTLVASSDSYLIQHLAFVAHLWLTLLILRPRDVNSYLKGVATYIVCFNFLYLLEFQFGMIPEYSGRYTGFNETAANLGAEIAAMGALAALYSFRLRYAMLSGCIALYAIMLMQGRSAALTVIGAMVIRVLLHLGRSQSRRTYGRLIIVLLLLLVLVAMAAFYMDSISSLLLLDNEYRGSGSDLVGRGDRWTRAFGLFLDNPFLGAGAGWYEFRNMETPHNFFLYGLSQFGLMSLLIYVPLFYCVARAWHLDRKGILIFLPIAVMAIFNDRFMNLNAYPYIMFIYFISAASLPSVRRPIGQNEAVLGRVGKPRNFSVP